MSDKCPICGATGGRQVGCHDVSDLYNEDCPDCGAKVRGNGQSCSELGEAAHVDCLQCQLSQRDARIAELEAIVAKLPKTKDGIPIVHGMTLYGWHPTPGVHEFFVDARYAAVPGVWSWYSTREAALAAALKENDNG